MAGLSKFGQVNAGDDLCAAKDLAVLQYEKCLDDNGGKDLRCSFSGLDDIGPMFVASAYQCGAFSKKASGNYDNLEEVR
eukprot:2984609-Karenia_brevis.AAC.1